MVHDTEKRVILKLIIYRIISIVTTFLLSWGLLGVATSAASVALIITACDHTAKVMILYVYEKLWNKITYGRKLKKQMSCCIWLTGLSGSGKSTVGEALVRELEKRLQKTEYLDGDLVRTTICKDLGFSKEDRDENLRRVSHVSGHLSRTSIVVCSFISPYRAARQSVKDLCNNFIEVYVNAPLEVCEARDPKGLYKKARAGQIKNFTGISDPYEAPENPDIELRTDLYSVDQCVSQVISYLTLKGLLK